MPATKPYPLWQFYPARSRPPAWVDGVIRAFVDAQTQIDSTAAHDEPVTSDVALAAVRPALEALGFQVESGKKKADKIFRPVLFGGNGVARVQYEVDAFHPGLNIVVEIEAGRGAAGNADYRDLIRTSLIVDAEYLILGMSLEYKSTGPVIRSYERTRDQIDAIYASNRLKLPFVGVLLIGY